MERIVLITDIDTPLGYALAGFYIKDGERVIGTVSSQDSDLPYMNLENIDIVEWRRFSALESRNLLLHIIKKYKKIDEAIVIQSVISKTRKLHETEISDIEKGIDFWLKGLFFICREIIRTYEKQKNGALFIINHSNKEQGISTVSETIKAGTREFTRNLISSYEKEAFLLNSIESSSPTDDTLSAFIYKTIKERLRQISGKQVNFRHKPGLFSGIKKVLKQD
ncbi:MAG: SDR family NAD(P)-dependent oxidoreductase [Spirochaetales bacterium]|nr:SDR family NAD(P)-dependent oxidoreductase [Spirochaetales bacterium]